MVKKVRLCRAVESNVGERRAYKKQLVRVQKDFQAYVLNEIFQELERQNALTTDAKLPTVPNLKELKRKTLKLLRRGVEFERFLQDLIAKNSKRWLDALRQVSGSVAERFVKKAMASSTNAQKAALIAAGVKPSLIKERWSVPVVGRQYLSPNAASAMPSMIKENVELITHIGENDITRITEVLTKGLQEGMDYNALRQELNATNGFDGARADRVALDQINKINQQVQIMNAQSLGCTHARWKHVPGQYTSRRTHMALDGQEFDLNEGLYDESVQRNVIPGQLPYCFPAGSQLTFIQGINKIYRHSFSGELTLLVTDGLEPLRTTPNHPVLTTAGWVRADSLKVGDDLITAEGKALDVFSANRDYGIATLDELFNTFKGLGASTCVLGGSDSQFHGDGSSDDEVNVVDVRSFLSDGFEPGGAHQVVEFILARTKKAGFGFFHDCFFNQDFMPVMRSTAGLLRGCNKRLALLSAHLSEPYIVSLGASAAFYTAFGELSVDNAPVYSVLLGNCEPGHSCNIISDGSVSVKTGDIHSLKQSHGAEFRSKPGWRSMNSVGGSLPGGAFLNKTVRINDIVHIPFSDYVYNLESLTGWFGCEHYTVHNCRCVSRLIIPKEATTE